MRVGASVRSFHPPGDARALVRGMVARAAAARAAGLDSLFVGDHHGTAAPYLQNVPILGRMLAEWGDRPAGALFLVPLWNPVLLAEQVGTLANVAAGRFIAQVCVGADPAQFAAMGVDIRRRGRDFEEKLAQLRALLAGDAIRLGEQEVRISPVPPEPVEYWIGAEARIAIDRAARLADAWLPGPNLGVAQAADALRYFRERCDHYGRAPTCTPIRRNLHVASDEREIAQRIRPALAEAGLGVDPKTVIIGTVEQVAEAFRELAARGFSEVIVRHFSNDPEQVLASFARLARVRELVRDA